MDSRKKEVVSKASFRGKSLVVIGLALLLSLLGLKSRDIQKVVNVLETNQPGTYTVTHIDDGDTITVNMEGRQERVRLIGIDTPELHHPEKPVQCFAQSALDFTAGLIDRNPVRLVADPEDDNRDLYGRLLRYVYLPDGTLVNTEIVRQGYGFAYTHFPFTKLEEMRGLERQARLEKRGLWAGCKIKHDQRGTPQTNPAG